MENMDINRIKEFRQFKKEIRGSEQHLIVGIDIAKDKHHAFLGTANGHTVQKGLIVENNLSGFSYLMGRVQFHMDRDGFEAVVFGLEPTSVYHKPLAEFLIEQGLTTHFAHYYHRLLDGRQREKGIRTKMRVKLAAKLLVIAWTLMKKKESFNPDYIISH